MFLCILFLEFYVNILCEGVFIVVDNRQTLDLSTTLDFVFLFFTLTSMSNFVLLTESLWDTEWGNRKWRSFLWSNTVPYQVAKPRYQCIVSSPRLLPLSGWWREMYETFKKTKTQLVLAEWPKQKGLKRWSGDRQIMKREIAFLWRCQYSSLAHYHYNSYNLY